MIKLIIVDDQEIYAKSIGHLLSQQPDMEVVARAYDELQAIRRAQIYPHDIILMDIVLGAGSGLDAAREIRRLMPSTKIIFMSAYLDPPFLVDVLAQQAAGYLSKVPLSFDELLAAIRKVHRGQRAFTHAAHLVASALAGADEACNIGPLPKGCRSLTASETRVFKLRAQRISIADVAQQLDVKPSTVRTLWERALDKLGIRPEPGPGYVPLPRLTDAP